MTVRGAFDQALKPGGKMAGYKTPNISKSKKKSFSRNYKKGSRRTAKGTRGKAMGMKSDHKPTGGGGTSMVGGHHGSRQRQGRGAPTPGSGPAKGGVRKVAV